MKIHSIRLENFAGVSSSKVTFTPTGVTVVEGPNEIGKSSLFQALDLLLDYRDSSTSQAVTKARPVHIDAGPEVEADLEVGEYRFTYSKRFQKSPQTSLVVKTPQPENLTGREAHDRVTQIIQSSVDAELWKALRIVQGEGTNLPDLHGQPALAQALDLAAGEVQADDSQLDLLDTIHDEFSRYWTDNGREKRDPLGIARKADDESKQEFEELGNDLRELEAEISGYSDLTRELSAAEDSVDTTGKAFEELETSWTAVSKLANGVELLESNYRAATAQLDTAVSAEQERTKLVEAVNAQSVALKTQSEQVADLQPVSKKAATDLAAVNERWTEARDASEQAEADLRLRRSDREYRDNELDLAQMSERLDRIRAAEEAAEDAVKLVAASTVTTKLRDAVREADVVVRTAHALLDSASPTVKITPLKDTNILMNDTEFPVALGESRSTTASEPVKLKIGDLADVEIAPGTGESDLQDELTNAEIIFDDLLEQAGVKDLDSTERALASRNEAERVISERDTLVSENLRDLSRESLEERIQRLQSSVEVYGRNRATSPELPLDLDEADEWLSEAEPAFEKSQVELSEASSARESARGTEEQSKQATAIAEALLEQVRGDSQRITDALDLARVNTRDEVLTGTVESTRKSVDAITDQLDAARKELAGVDPKGTSERLETARAASEAAKTRQGTLRTDMTALRARLDTLGEQGLAEALAGAETGSVRASSELERILRRASAAKLLYRTMSDERDIAQRQYVGPLRDRVRQLGKYVFNESFDVEIDDELQVTHRTLNGVILPYENLSTGAREQIGLLMRLAAALLADSAGGVPVVLDDTLGSTDRSRLEGAGVAITVAARDCQVILLTSMPERYQHIDISQSVRLS